MAGVSPAGAGHAVTAILFFCLAWALCAVVGLGVAACLLPRGWQAQRLLLAPAIGAAALVLLTSVASYLGMNMRAAALPVAGGGVAISLTCAWVCRSSFRHAASWRTAAFVHILGFIAAAGVLLSVVLYRSWNPYNDAFTYVVISDYLQTHGFLEPAVKTASEPLLTQVWIYQTFGFRMGADFLLAFVAALFRVDYSFDVYLPVLALSLSLNLPGFWIFCRRALFMPALTAGVATGLYALHVGVPLANALSGFFPQTLGMAFALPLFALCARGTSPGDRIRRRCAPGLFGAALLLTYTEIVPFVLFGIGAVYFVRVTRGRLPMATAVISGAAPIVVAVALAPVAAWEFVPAMLHQAGAVVGWDPRLSLFDYLGMLAGYRSPAHNPLAAPGAVGGALRFATVTAAITAGVGAIGSRRRAARFALYLGSGVVLAVMWFSLFAANPWQPGEFGHPWSTFKAVTYGWYLFVALWAVGLSAWWRHGGLYRVAAASQLAFFVVASALGSLATARSVSRDVRVSTGNQRDPLGEYKRLGSLVGLPAGQPINLRIPSEALKHRQWVAYFLRRPVIADWSDDDYIGTHLDAAARRPQLDPRYPTLVYTPGAATVTAANLTLFTDVGTLVETEFGDGWHGRERDASNWWRWLAERGTMEVTVQRRGWLTLHSEIAVVGSPSRRITLSLAEVPDATNSYTLQEQWFTPFTSKRIHVDPGRYHVSLTADGPPHIMSETDPRSVRIGARNLTWVLTPD